MKRWVKAGDQPLPSGRVGLYAVRRGRRVLQSVAATSNIEAMARAAALYPRSSSLTLTLEGWYQETAEVSR